MKRFIYFLLSFIILFSLSKCSNNNNLSDEVGEYYSEDEGYEDGTYCADVTYSNPKTGTNSSYTLEVEVQNNELITIYWSNGGSLDEDHFSSEILDENGYCSFISDNGCEYEIQLTGKNCGYTDELSFQNDLEDDKIATTCPNCGDEKDANDHYCYSCKTNIEDEEENTCSSCGNYEYGVYGGLCSNCRQEDEENEEF